DYLGTGIKPILPRQPRLQRGTGYAQLLGHLTLGEPLGVQLALPCQPVSTFEASPALGAIMIATGLILDYRCPSLPPLPNSLPCAKWRAKDGEVAPWLQSLSVSSQVCSRSSSRRDGRRHDRGPYAYLHKRSQWMRYQSYRKQHLPIGSGITEAACKIV